jgi:hypothetical protein
MDPAACPIIGATTERKTPDWSANQSGEWKQKDLAVGRYFHGGKDYENYQARQPDRLPAPSDFNRENYCGEP